MTPQEELKALRAERNKKQLSAQEELKQLRSSQTIERLKSFDELIKDSPTQDEQMFDYEKGARGGLRAKLSFMETTEEKEQWYSNKSNVNMLNTKQKSNNIIIKYIKVP